MIPPDRSHDYVDVLRDTLPSAEDKERMRQRLLSLGVGAAAASVPASAGAQGLAKLLAKLGASSVGKAAVVLSVSASVGGSVVLLSSPSTPESKPTVTHAPRQSREVLPSEPVGALPSAAPREARAPDVVPPSTAARKPRVKRAAPAALHAESLDTLPAENALLGAAVAALHHGERERARRLLDEHEQRFPHGVLRHERERARERLAEPAPEAR